jgi:hypothetical protein
VLGSIGQPQFTSSTQPLLHDFAVGSQTFSACGSFAPPEVNE